MSFISNALLGGLNLSTAEKAFRTVIEQEKRLTCNDMDKSSTFTKTADGSLRWDGMHCNYDAT